MDSLLATYASSDEEDDPQPQKPQLSPPPKPPPLFSSVPQRKLHNEEVSKPSSLFSSLPQPSTPFLDDRDEKDSKPTSLFSSIPQPNSQKQPLSNLSSVESNHKKVVQFRPPISLPPPTVPNDSDDVDDEEEEEKATRRRKQSEASAQGSSVKSFLSFIPAPRNSTTLGVLPSSGSGRRSILDTGVSASSSAALRAEPESDANQNTVDYENADQNTGNHVTYTSYGNHESSIDQNVGDFADTANYGNYESGTNQYDGNYVDYSSYGSYQSSTGQNIGSSSAPSYGSYESYGNYYGKYDNNWVGGSAATVPESSGIDETGAKLRGKRGRNQLPTEIVEVKQDELIKNRPREDQVKLTGIAFGPAYQPASTKGKPSKLHKRKHQIGTLYYDMKQKEMELAERRAKGFLTKAETQAKYGW